MARVGAALAYPFGDRPGSACPAFTEKLSIRPLLCIQYVRDDGKRDVMGCSVRDFDHWAR